MVMKGPKVDLIISAYNNASSVRQIISLIQEGTHRPSSIHITDDGSNSQNRKIIENQLNRTGTPSFYHWHNDRGFRKSKILNQGILNCKSEYIVFLDGDCLPHRHFVSDHLVIAEKGNFVQGRRCFIHQDKVACLLDGKTSLTRLMLSGKVRGLLKSIRLPIPYIKRNKTMYGLLGCNLGAWRDDLLKVNGFDEDYEGWGREDSDLCARFYNLGLMRKMVYGRALVYHLNHTENEREGLKRNDKLLRETLDERKTRCTNGITKE
jgi:glycosyltransferase involved in cell wall biosynthesis